MKNVKLFMIFVLNIILQTTVISRLELFGVHPNLSIAWIVVIAILEGPLAGGLFGLFTGLVGELLFSGVVGVRALMYFLIGYLVGDRASYTNSRSMKPIVFFAAISTIIVYLGSHIVLSYFGKQALLYNAIVVQLFLEIIFNVVATLLVYTFDSKGRTRRNYYGF